MSESSANFTKAILFILLAIFLFDVQGAIIKHMGDRFPVAQLATFRNIFGLMPSLLVLFLSREWHEKGRKLAIRQWRFALLRGFYLAGAQYCFYLSLVNMELATATTLTFIGPVFITLLSIILLKHRVGIWRWLAVVLGFLGVLLIMRPGSDIFTLFALLPILAAFGYSLSVVSVRLLDDSIPTATINLYGSVGALVGSTIILLSTGGYIAIESVTDWFWLIAMGTVGGFAVLSLITAYRLTRPSSVSPFEYFGIPFSFALGWLFFDESPFETLFPGVVLVVAGGLLIAWRERKKKESLGMPVAE
ncbi:MAG: DMT family transporter [Gammaproteobacteria bacterium]